MGQTMTVIGPSVANEERGAKAARKEVVPTKVLV
jgi:hypothetical protein